MNNTQDLTLNPQDAQKTEEIYEYILNLYQNNDQRYNYIVTQQPDATILVHLYNKLKHTRLSHVVNTLPNPLLPGSMKPNPKTITVKNYPYLHFIHEELADPLHKWMYHVAATILFINKTIVININYPQTFNLFMINRISAILYNKKYHKLSYAAHYNKQLYILNNNHNNLSHSLLLFTQNHNHPTIQPPHQQIPYPILLQELQQFFLTHTLPHLDNL